MTGIAATPRGEQPQHGAPPAVTGDAGAPSVLVVEADAALARLVRRWLRAECGDVRVAVAPDGRAALPLVEAGRAIHAVLLDVGPVARPHALRLARAIRRRFGRRLPIVATFPAADEIGDLDDLRALGVDLLVGKATGRTQETADELGRIALTLLLSQGLI